MQGLDHDAQIFIALNRHINQGRRSGGGKSLVFEGWQGVINNLHLVAYRWGLESTGPTTWPWVACHISHSRPLKTCLRTEVSHLGIELLHPVGQLLGLLHIQTRHHAVLGNSQQLHFNHRLQPFVPQAQRLEMPPTQGSVH